MATLLAKTNATSALRVQRHRTTPLAVPRPMLPSSRVAPVVRASSEGGDFDAVLMKWADEFEKLDNKPAVVGYIAGSVFVVFFTEWLIHLPVLDVLLGFPVQLLGLLALPVLVTRYALEGKDVGKDAGNAVADIAKRLPGLEKK